VGPPQGVGVVRRGRLERVSAHVGQVGRVDPRGPQVRDPRVAEVVRGAVQLSPLAGGVPDVAVEVPLAPQPAGWRGNSRGVSILAGTDQISSAVDRGQGAERTCRLVGWSPG
jgi:hypothetical protein